MAVLDTGIDRLPDFSGRLIGGVDLTGENDPFQDDYGHGTFVAGLIAGDGASSDGQYQGEAPGADLVSIKVAGADGTTHLVRLILGLQWAVDHRLAYDIKVLNMSLGFRPFESTAINPLDLAVEAAWNSGIAVVASAGNAGPFNGTILSPGDDPLVITVGALDDMAQPVTGDDEMTNFSSAGPTLDRWLGQARPGHLGPVGGQPGRARLDDLQREPLGPDRLGRTSSAPAPRSARPSPAARRPWCWPTTPASRRTSSRPGCSATPTRARSATLRRRARGPQRLRGGHRRPDEPQAVRLRPAAGPARRDGLAVPSGQSGRHLERESVVGCLLAAGVRGRARVARQRVERPGLERLAWTGRAWNNGGWTGAAWNGAAWDGSAWNGSAGPARPGTAPPGPAAAWNSSAWN